VQWPVDAQGIGLGYTVSVTLAPEKAETARSPGAFGWGGAAGTMSWTEPERELSAVIMVQQPAVELPAAVSKAIGDAIVDYRAVPKI